VSEKSSSMASMFRFYLGLAFKNLWRHKRRTILTTLAIAVGIFYYIVFDSLMTGINRDSIQSMLDLEVGHFQLIPADADSTKKPDLKQLVPNGPVVTSKLRTVPGIQAVAPRLLFAASLISGIEELPIIGIGVDPQLDGTVFKIQKYLTGRWVNKGAAEVVLGKRAADLLQLKLGDMVTIRTQTKTETYQALDLTVVGIVNCPDPTVNEGQMFLPLDAAGQALGTGDAVSQVVVKTAQIHSLEKVVQDTNKLHFPGFRFRLKTWREAAVSLLAVIQQKQVFQYILLFMVAIIAVIGVVNSTLLASLERGREIGILKAMGMTELEITRLFAYEATGLGFIGGLIGILLGLLFNCYLVYVGLDFEKMFGNINFGFSVDKIYGVWNPGAILGAFIFGMFVSLLASWLPARHAAKVDPAASLRKV
jgi:ABC-type lipoprotein release transport system permease subunit